MTTTITVTTKRQVVLPKAMCERKRTRPITAEDEAVIQDEITKYRAEKRRRKA